MGFEEIFHRMLRSAGIAYGMMGLQFMAWIGPEFGPSDLWHQRSGLRMNRFRDRPRSIPMRAVTITRLRRLAKSAPAFATSPWRRLSHAKIGAALLETQRPSRASFLRLDVRSLEAVQHRGLIANSRQNVMLP
ncbi:hypothetical protein [Bradyrhizobium sp. CCBAU 11361]|uniref:hypothetical protein n=1 Tax=Bradyrhizobium sp. CCBAU 11361 TaxID=1630812 RepID=UPI0023048B3A|nr:hypothetical protein [Bradyrhizobium sp. CCBAU 11361]MDA9489015.1 hypothetical protein [Bradyrhizobium sp. CCBAU 11361]